jgi:tRNA pseudouridine38-40 synthase
MIIALGIEYAGTNYCGWKIQDHVPSVQACVEAALSKVANHPVKVVCAGSSRTYPTSYNRIGSEALASP